MEKIVPVLASGYKPLLGVAMMEDYHLEIDFADNGLVSLKKNYKLGILSYLPIAQKLNN